MWLSRRFTDLATTVAHASGRPLTFIIAMFVIAVWAVTGPMFGYSDTWQLIINTGTTIVTFLMVFLIQNTQSRDGAAIQAKLDELIRTSAAQNFYIGIEHLTEEELQNIRERCEERAKGALAEKAGKAADTAQKRANQRALEAADQGTVPRVLPFDRPPHASRSPPR